MKKSFMTRALAMGLSLAMAFSLSAATNVSVASAAATPAMASKQFAVRVGGAAKSYKASTATQKSFKITKATVGNTDKATVKVNSSKKSIKVTPGTVTGSTVVTVTFKNIKTAKSTAKKYRCVVKAAIEPEKPVEPEVVKATKITEATPASAKTIKVTFDGVVDTSTATAIKVTRGTTAITVSAKYADDSKSVILTSDTSLATGTYTVTVGSFEPATFNVVKQTPTTLKIANTTVANNAKGRVYFQVLDQYGDVMENYTASKLVVNAYNTTKGHNIGATYQTLKKDYFELNCSTEDLGQGAQKLNSIGDKISVVAYLKDNAGVSCTTELEIVRVYTDELTFGDVKLGDDKRVTVNRAYELAYEATDTEGNKVTFDEQGPGKNTDGSPATATTVTIGNFNFVSSNTSAIDMTSVSVDSDGRLKFETAGTDGTAIITAINTITGKSTSVTIVVNNRARLSALDVADASVACNATSGTKFKAAVTAYDQFGEVIDAKNVKNVKFYDGTAYSLAANYFSITPTDTRIVINGITSDGKYVEYKVNGDISTLENQSVTFNFISKLMGENGYVRSSSVVSVDDEIEASALEIVKAPVESIGVGQDVKVQVVVKDQYQNKMELDKTPGFNYNGAGVSVKTYITNDVLASVGTMTAVPGEDKVYEIKMPASATVATGNLYKSGSFTIKLEDDGKVIASKTFNLEVVDAITRYEVETDKDSYKAGDTVTVTVDAYSSAGFNPYYNGSDNVAVVVSKGAVTADKKFTKTLKFEKGSATFTLTAGTVTTANNEYRVNVKNLVSGVSNVSDKYAVVASAAGKLKMDNDGQLYLTDSQGNKIDSRDRTEFATIKVFDETANSDITGSVDINSNGAKWNKKNDNTVEVEIAETDSKVKSFSNGDGSFAAYDMGNLTITSVPATCNGHNLVLSITIGGFTWDKKIVADGTGTANFSDTGKAGNRFKAEEIAKAAVTEAVAKIRTVSGTTLTTSSYTPISGASIKLSAEIQVVTGAGVFAIDDKCVSGTSVTIGFGPEATSASAIKKASGHGFKIVYTISASKTYGDGTDAVPWVTDEREVTVYYTADADSGTKWIAASSDWN